MQEIRPQYIETAPAIVEASSEAIVSVDCQGTILSSNSRFGALLDRVEDEVRSLNLFALFPDLELDSFNQKLSSLYEPLRLLKPDGSARWVLVKVISIGLKEACNYTLLIQDPESVRRIIDRLDYIESYDVDTGLFNRHKGLLEFEQLQASGLAGGCFLAKFDYPDDAPIEKGSLAKQAKLLLQYLGGYGEQQIACRYSSAELLFVFAADRPTPNEQILSTVQRLHADGDIAGHMIRLAFQEWATTRQAADSLIEQLRIRLSPISDPRLFEERHSGESQQSLVRHVARIRQALEAGELAFFIQPQISTLTRRVASGELLVRWVTPAGEIIPPSQFIDHLEVGELSTPFLEWSIRETARTLQLIHQQTGDWVPLSVNVSPGQITEGNLLQLLLESCAAHAVPAEHLEVEITERVLATDHTEVLRVLKELKQHGFKIAIDDFGTGYSSLAYLRQYPLDRLKIDRVFVTNLVDIEEDRLIASSIASLAHVLGLEIVVEGIEETAQARFFQDLGCEFFQGYLTGKPMAVKDFIRQYTEQVQGIDLLEEAAHPQERALIDVKAHAIAWKKSFSTDIVSVDNEHRDLVEALNHFSEAYQADPDGLNLVESMGAIGNETARHFEHEELVMRNICYPRYKEHREKHRALIADFAKRCAEIESDPQSVDFDELLRYLKYWLLRHLVSEDTHLHRYLNRTSSERRSI